MSQEFSIDLSSNLTNEEMVVLQKKFDLTPHEIMQIQVIINSIDKILNIQDDDSANPRNIDTSKQARVKMSSLDIYKFRLNNRNCMRSIALYTFGDPNHPSISEIFYREGTTHQNVFTIADLFYSRNKGNDLTIKKLPQDKNFVTDMNEWFEHVWEIAPGNYMRSLKLLVTSQYDEMGNYLIGGNYRDMNGNNISSNLMINVFILFIALSDQI